MKLSNDPAKTLVPARKRVFRLVGSDGVPLLDLLTLSDESPPQPGQRILVRHPFVENKRAYVTPSQVISLLTPVFQRGRAQAPCSLQQARARCADQLAQMRNDHIRALNPTPYKISVSERLYDYMHELWMREMPIKELS